MPSKMRFNKKELAQYSSSGFDFEGRLNYRTAGGNFTQPGEAYFPLKILLRTFLWALLF